MWGWDSICWVSKQIDKTVREDAPAKLKQYTPDQKKLHNVFMCCNWDSICLVTRKIDKTLREDAISKFKEHVPDQRDFWTNCAKFATEELIQNCGVPGARPFYKCLKKSFLNSQSGVRSQPHGLEGNENEKIMLMHEHKRAEIERGVRMMLLVLAAQTKPSQTQTILKITAPNNQPFSPDAVINLLKESQMSQDCFDHVESEDN